MRAERELQHRVLAQGLHGSTGGRIVAPPLLAAYAQLLGALLPVADTEEQGVVGGSGEHAWARSGVGEGGGTGGWRSRGGWVCGMPRGRGERCVCLVRTGVS